MELIKGLVFLTLVTAVLVVYQYLDMSIMLEQPFPLVEVTEKTSNTLADNFDVYVRLTNISVFVSQIEEWPIKSMKLFFLKKFMNLLVVLDDEKPEDHTYGKNFPISHPEFNTRICYMKSYPEDVFHGWGKARMYLDMMHADQCTQKEYVGFIDVDTLFVTAVTDNLLFEGNKPIITGRIGVPRIPCWIATGKYVVGRKQVMQCMSYFPVTFKVSHIAEMRKYVEKLHNKTFTQVFKEAPKMTKQQNWCYCHYSIMCNYMWYFHRDEYAWHLQVVPGGKWSGEGALPSMVGPSYFQNEVKDNEKVPIPRSSVHTRHLIYDGKYQDAVIPPPKETNKLLKEGLCYSFGFKLCPKSCSNYDEKAIHDSLFAFENYRWQWDSRCKEKQSIHYQTVHNIMQHEPEQFNLDLKDTNRICSLIDSLV